MKDMTSRTVDWTAPRSETPQAEGLRERKKRLMRQQLTDAATEMFIERGFDGFRVTDVAEACGVSEKTVFNYFPTKESLVLDRLDATIASLRTALLDQGVTPLEATMRVLDDELAAHTSWLASQDNAAQAAAAFQRFRDLIDQTPSLRGYENDMTAQLTVIAAQLIADRAGMTPDDPEPQIAASALIGLWRVQRLAMRRYLDGTRSPAKAHQAISADVQRAAQLINTGLNSLTGPTTTSRPPRRPATRGRR
jgi:AcrR family transcriptional regulator